MKFAAAAILASVFFASAEAKGRGRKWDMKKCSYYSRDAADADKVMGSIVFKQKKAADGAAEEPLYAFGKWKKNTVDDTDYSVSYYDGADCTGTSAEVGTWSKDSDDTTCDKWAKTELTGYSMADGTTATDVSEAYFGLSVAGESDVLFCCQVTEGKKKSRK